MKGSWRTIIFIELVFLFGPVAFMHLLGTYLLIVMPVINDKYGSLSLDAFLLPVLLAIPGIGLLSLLKLGLRYEAYARTSIPVSIGVGLIVDFLSFLLFVYYLGLGLFSDPLIFMLLGGGPIITLLTILYVVCLIRKSCNDSGASLRC